MRLRKKTWAIGEVMENPLLIDSAESNKGVWRECFQNTNPLHLEIGCGKGAFVCEMAALNPDINFVALEREMKIIAMALKKARLAELKNVRFINTDAKCLTELFAPGEIDLIYINFCDPWPNKKKWAKRRLTHRAFIEVYKQLLSENDRILFKTDNRELFDFSIEEFTASGFELQHVTFDLYSEKSAEKHDEKHTETLVKTEYEKKFIRKGQPIHRLEAVYRICNKFI